VSCFSHFGCVDRDDCRVYPNGTGEKEQPGNAYFVSGTNIKISSVDCALPRQGVLVQHWSARKRIMRLTGDPSVISFKDSFLNLDPAGNIAGEDLPRT
jgi:hypothetical protein